MRNLTANNFLLHWCARRYIAVVLCHILMKSLLKFVLILGALNSGSAKMFKWPYYPFVFSDTLRHFTAGNIAAPMDYNNSNNFLSTFL